MKNVLILCAIVSLFSCAKSESSNENKIHVLLLDIQGPPAKEIRTKKISPVDDEYFEISLMSMANGTTFIARREMDVEQPKSGQYFNLRELTIIDPAASDSAEMHFPGSNEFLNYMAQHNYEMVDQKKGKYRTDYTFKRKQ